MWFPFLMFDGFVMYGMIGVFGLLALISMEYDRPGLCTAIVALALLILEYYSPLKPISFAISRPIDALMLFGAYFAAGSLWIIVKWLSHVYKVRDRFNEVKDSILADLKKSKSYGVPLFKDDGSLTEDGRVVLYSTAAARIHERELPLQVSHHKAEIYMWWLCWPLSLFWTLLCDPITRLWHFVYNLFGGWMQAISDNAFKIK